MAQPEGLSEVELAIFTIVASAAADGVRYSMIKQHVGETVELSKLTDGMRSLLATSKIQMKRIDGGDYLVHLKKSTMPENFAIVLDVVRSAGNAGIDAAAIAMKTKLVKTEVTKALNQLGQQGYVKDTRCFTNKAKKLYILSDVEPSSQVTGGTFYTEERDIDIHLVDTARAKVVHLIKNRDTMSTMQIKQHLDGAGLAKKLSLKEVDTIATTLELDGVLERVGRGQLEELASRQYKISQHRPEPNWATHIPCVGCPQVARCNPSGAGSTIPQNCTYLNDWLAEF